MTVNTSLYDGRRRLMTGRTEKTGNDIFLNTKHDESFNNEK